MNDSKYNFKLINKAGKDIKSAIYQTNKIICDRSSFHVEIQPNDPDPSKIELYKNAYFNAKIPLRGYASPLKINVEYCNSINK